MLFRSPCERIEETTVTQALHLMNSTALHEKVVADKGRAAELAAGELPAEKIIEDLYLATYNRLPDEQEQSLARQLFGGDDDKAARRRAAEDLMWALINTPEFVFKD